MRFYIRANGRLSSITMPESLADYLIAKLGGLGEGDPKEGKLAQAWINDLANRQAVPDKNVSQWVQAQALHFVVDPAILVNRDAARQREAVRREERKEWLAARMAEFHAKKSAPNSARAEKNLCRS